MQVKKIVSLSFLSCLATSVLSAEEMKYSNLEIYTNMCSKCHGEKAQGNPKKKAPALNDQTAHELEISLFDLKAGGLNQSSGSNHDIMAHNMKKIIKKGMNYNPKSMALFIFNSFNAESAFYKDFKKDKNYTVSEIYGKMCSKCHGLNAQGNPKKKAPALNEMTAHEIEAELLAIQNPNMNQSSGNNHELMEHNQEQIEKKGMYYKPKEMAKYIAEHFHVNK